MSKMDWSRKAAPRQASLRSSTPATGKLADPKWVAKAHGCLRAFDALSPAEQRFVEDILARIPARLSEKQNAWLAKIVAKVEAARQRAS
jgi:hypothetical protein